MSFECVPQKLVYGGEALGYHQGRPIFIPRALPGERLLVEPISTAKGVVRARPLKILEAARERVQPPCPYYGRCGGCHYQHLSAERQSEVKLEILRETLRRIGKINWESEIRLHVAHPWNYRNQAQFKAALQPDGRVALGFFEAESHRLFPVDVCLILSPRLNALLAELRSGEWSKRLAGCREIDLLADHRDEQVMLTLRGSFSREESVALACDLLARLPGVVTLAIAGDRDSHVFGKPALYYAVGEFQYRISPGAFFQSSRYLLTELVEAVVANESGGLALDLFAGVGFFTLSLAKRFSQAVGVEAQARAAADLAANAQANNLANVRVVQETAFDFLRRFAQAEVDLIVLDPPRAGVGKHTLKFLAGLRPKRINYVSCHPPTLARDLSLLIDLGYQLNSVEMFDFFPQTFHIESLARLARQ